MSDLVYCPLDHRGVIRLTGEDRHYFLQGLVSADVERAADESALYGAFLTPQGKFLYDFFLAGQGESLLMEAEQAGREDFIRRLARFKLRAKVSLAAAPEFRVFALIGDGAAAALGLPDRRGAALPWQGGVIFVDPRLAQAGLRAWLPPSAMPALHQAGFAAGTAQQWDTQRIMLGLPDGSRDLVPEKTILLEAGFDELGGVDWQKGCFLGQEVTARSKYRGQIKKRLLPVSIDGPAPPPGTLLYVGSQEVGEMRSHAGNRGLAVVRLDILPSLAGRGLSAGTATLTPQIPDWAIL